MGFETTTETMESVLTDIIGWELDQSYCREVVTLTATAVAKGAVLARNAAGAYLLQAPAASDGTQTPRAIALEAGDASGKVLVLRRNAIVKSSALVWAGGITAGQKTTAIQVLADAGILVRDDV
jgi:hypothetical protein